MRRVLVILSLMTGLAFGASSIPMTQSNAGPPAGKSTGTVTIDRDEDSFSTPITAIVTATRPTRRGGLVAFSVAPLQNAPKELIKYTYVWVVSPDPGGLFLWPDGTQGAFGSGTLGDPQQYTLTVVSNFAFVSADNKLTLKSTKTSTVIDIDDGGVIPPPGPGPGPSPGPVPPGPGPNPGPGPVPPAPVIPDGRYKLGQFMYDLSKTMPAAERAALATELHRLSGLISAGAATPAPNPGIRTKAQLVSETVAGFPKALGASLVSWQPILTQMTTKMDSLNIVAIADCQTAFNELAAGLEAK